jgi:phospholipid transport system substrate-binding protein
LAACCLAAVLSFSAASTFAKSSAATPEAKVRQTAEAALKVLQNDSLSVDQKRTMLEAQLGDCCDFEVTSKLVLARNWLKLSAEQKREFVVLFKDYLIATYGRNIDSYSGETLEILGGHDEPRGDYTVKTRINGGKANDTLVDYRLRKDAAGDWRIIDVVAEGISLVSNLRSQFQEIVSNGGPEELLRVLRAKVGEHSPVSS